VKAARPFVGDDTDGEALERRALEALRAGQASVARDRVELAILRGRDDLAPVFEALEAASAGADSTPAAEDLPPLWREALGNRGPIE